MGLQSGRCPLALRASAWSVAVATGRCACGRSRQGAWIDIACKRLQYHPLLNQPEIITNDPEFHQAAALRQAACQERGWRLPTLSSQAPTPWVNSILDRIASVFGR
ncbi:MAG: hypothetical protein AAF171_15985 [Cyanobacteria bacterium P01_A01_bin.116]